eukprot:2537668-Lingulodinium_polyedra.AAC.1
MQHPGASSDGVAPATTGPTRLEPKTTYNADDDDDVDDDGGLARTLRTNGPSQGRNRDPNMAHPTAKQ